MIKYSVLICTYHGERYIKEQVQSILDQKYKPEMVIVSDDSSNDLTKEACRQVFNENDYNDFIVINGSKKGVINNFIEHININRSEFLFLSDQDDIWCDNKIEEFEKVVTITTTPMLWFSDSCLIDTDGNLISHSFFSFQGLSEKVLNDDSIVFKNAVQGATCCLNLPLCKLVDQSLKHIDIKNIAMHDWWIALLAKYYGQWDFIDQPLVMYRQHSLNVVGAKRRLSNYMNVLIKPWEYYARLKLVLKQKEELISLASYIDTKIVFNKKDSFKCQQISYLKLILIKITILWLRCFKNK
ncbi:glycosyltransferase [Vibrio gazogenes]|uniref:Glycosyltransferase 2-like domain-containing protein n=1 Tax=Vibrio gazogenes TaxID=687 RepID=A0A1Z2SFG0_VIBGA|nr:glycosyltransferase [Vibrio gazogenes]ASA55906.1 hypothetical protein BSQ33_09515 [Vibrio gazogenes]